MTTNLKRLITKITSHTTIRDNCSTLNNICQPKICSFFFVMIWWVSFTAKLKIRSRCLMTIWSLLSTGCSKAVRTKMWTSENSKDNLMKQPSKMIRFTEDFTQLKLLLCWCFGLFPNSFWLRSHPFCHFCSKLKSNLGYIISNKGPNL